jgi:hypothetical protein
MTKPRDQQGPRPPESSAPELRVAYTPAGRATLEAIAGELVPLPLPASAEHESSSPEIIVREGVMGRETLAAIIEEARPSAAAGDANETSEGVATSPEKGATSRGAAATPAALEIFEMMTYVVRGVDTMHLSSDAQRRGFVEEHLLARLPVESMNDVARVDVTPWTARGTFVVRVWCNVATSR